jgi:hypothetical protein
MLTSTCSCWYAGMQQGESIGSMLFEERLEAAERRRLDGNALFSQARWPEALGKYSLALSHVDEDLMMQVEGFHLDKVQVGEAEAEGGWGCAGGVYWWGAPAAWLPAVVHQLPGYLQWCTSCLATCSGAPAAWLPAVVHQLPGYLQQAPAAMSPTAPRHLPAAPTPRLPQLYMQHPCGAVVWHYGMALWYGTMIWHYDMALWMLRHYATCS